VDKDPSGSPGRTTLLYRQVRLNRDLAILSLIIATTALFGYTIRGDFTLQKLAHAAGEIIAIVILILWKIHTPQGKLSSTLSARANKKEEDLDEWGRTILR
jgi:hypothetical protein